MDDSLECREKLDGRLTVFSKETTAFLNSERSVAHVSGHVFSSVAVPRVPVDFGIRREVIVSDVSDKAVCIGKY